MPQIEKRITGLIAPAFPALGGQLLAVPGRITVRGVLGVTAKYLAWRRTVMLPEPLKEELDAYAFEHRGYGPVETAALIPHMLQAFLRTDRSWCSRRKRRGKHNPVEPAQPATQA